MLNTFSSYEAQTKENIMHLKFSFPGFVSSSARDLIRKILREPSKRYNLQNIREHLWITKLIGDLDQTLTSNNFSRILYILITHNSGLLELNLKLKKVSKKNFANFF